MEIQLREGYHLHFSTNIYSPKCRVDMALVSSRMYQNNLGVLNDHNLSTSQQFNMAAKIAHTILGHIIRSVMFSC